MPNKINQSFDKLNVVSFRSSNSSGKLSINEELKKYNITREPVVLLEDVNLDKNLEFVGDTVVINEERRKKFTCYICMAKFSSAQSMSKHRALHSDSELDDNDTLSEDTWSKSKSKTVPPQNLIPKPKLKPKDSTENINKDCGETVVTKEPQKVTSFKCETCDVYFESSDDAKLHTVSNKCKFFCKICGRKFNTLYAFVVHLMQHRSNAAKSQNSSNMVYKCATCNKSFDNCLLLRSHEINAHQPKPDKVPSNPEPVANTSKEETSTVVKEEPVEPPIDDPADDTQPNEICCELCYDVFESAEDLEAHMEFHKQLETKTNTIVIEDDEDEVVEVYEEKKDPNEIITTIKSTTKPPQTRQAVPPSMNPTLLTTTSVTTASNHALTDTIKDMLTPKVEKQSKTILLPPVALPRLIPISKLKQSLASSQKSTAQPENTDLELRRTGPLSYSLCFKEDGTSSLGSSTSTAGTSNVGLKTSSPAVSNAVPLYASALINPSPVSIAPSTSSTSAVTASSNLQFFITNVPYVSGLQAAPINNALPTVTNNIAANTSSALATSSINASNITYVVAPSNAFVPPILVNDPEKNLAYVILPHNNSSIVNPTESVTTPKIQTTETSNSLPAVLNTTPQAVTSTTTTTSTGQFQSCVPMATGEASPLPVIANYFTTGGKPGANVLKTTIARTESTSTSDTANSNAKPSKPGPSKELEDSIVIDSDSSNEDNREENRVIKNNTGNESESDALVIDESSVTTEKNEGEVNAGSKDEDDKTEKKKYKFPMKCNGCSVIFQRMKSMRHHLDRRHCCQLCDFKCCKASDFKQHYILAHRKFFCSRCSVLADTKRSFTEHNRRNHICQECNGFFFNLAHHTCPKVREIASNGSKDDGKKSHHSTSEEPIEVDGDNLGVKEISKCFVLLTGMKLSDETNNAAIASKERRKKYTCYVCMTKFFTASDLDKHKSQHNDENDADLVTKDDDKDSDYSGNESEESESDQDYDLTEKISVPSIEDTNPTTCNLFNCFSCKVVFRSLSDLRTHPSRECTFSCKLCARNLDNADVFLCHIIYHKINFLSLRFFKCAVCSLFFKSYFQLRKHESVSHNLKPWADSGKLPPLPDSDSKETVEPCIVPKEEPPDQDLSEARGSTTAIACELCFDLCNSDEEFFTHMEFHRQLTIKDSEDSEIINNEFNIPNSKVAKFALTSAPIIRPKIKTIRNSPKPEKSKLPVSSAKSNPSGANDSTSKRCTVNKQDVLMMTNATFPYKIQLSSRDSDERCSKVINSSDKTLKVASKPPNVAFRQLDPTTLTKRLVLRKVLRPSGKWCLSKNDSAKVKDYFNSKIQEVKAKKNKNVEKNCLVFTTTANDVTTTASKVVVRDSGVSTSSVISTIKSYPEKGQRVLRKILPSQDIVKTANTTTIKSPKMPRQDIPTSKSNTPKAVVRNKKIPVPRVNTVKGMQTTLPPSTNIAPTPPKVATVPPTPNSYISLPLDKQDPNSEQPNNWTNSSNTNVANSNLIYVINPGNNLGMPSEPQLTYINDNSNFMYFFMPSNAAENVANVNFSPQTSAIQNTYPVQEANKVVYTLPSVDQSLNLVPQNDNSQLSNPVGMPLLSSDNLIFITNQPSSSVQTSMQTSGMINTIVSENSLQPSGPTSGYFPQS